MLEELHEVQVGERLARFAEPLAEAPLAQVAKLVELRDPEVLRREAERGEIHPDLRIEALGVGPGVHDRLTEVVQVLRVALEDLRGLDVVAELLDREQNEELLLLVPIPGCLPDELDELILLLLGGLRLLLDLQLQVKLDRERERLEFGQIRRSLLRILHRVALRSREKVRAYKGGRMRGRSMRDHELLRGSNSLE